MKYKSGRGSQNGISNNPKGSPRGARKSDKEKRNKNLTFSLTEEEITNVRETLTKLSKQMGLSTRTDTLLKILKDYDESL